MGGFLAVTRMELRLMARSRGLPIAALCLALVGAWEASTVREQPWGAFGGICFTGVLISLPLTLSTGQTIRRDTIQRLDGVLFSTPMDTVAYVCGKYLAAVIVLLGLVGVSLAGVVLMDRFDGWTNPPVIFGHSVYPPLGPWPYVAGWLWLIVPAVLFGAAFMLAGSTARHGGRVAATTGALVLWLGPLLGGRGWPALLDIPGMTVYYMTDSGQAAFALAMQSWARVGHDPRGQGAVRVVQLVQQTVPPIFPLVFLWNRALVIGFTALLVACTIESIRRQRRERDPGRTRTPMRWLRDTLAHRRAKTIARG